MFKYFTTLLIFLAPLLPSSTPLPLTETTLSTDYTSHGYLIALNATAPYFAGAGPVAGCITSIFTWTLDNTACGLFDGTRTVYNQSIGMWMYALRSERGTCGLIEGGRVTCSETGNKNQGKWSVVCVFFK